MVGQIRLTIVAGRSWNSILEPLKGCENVWRFWIRPMSSSKACGRVSWTGWAPVLTLEEAKVHPHMVSRQTYVKVGDMMQVAPAPRFSRTQATVPTS